MGCSTSHRVKPRALENWNHTPKVCSFEHHDNSGKSTNVQNNVDELLDS